MPTGKRIDWSVLDNLITEYLPHMTITEFTKKYAPFLNSGTIRTRANSLGVRYKPAYFALYKDTPEILEKIRSLRDTHSLNQISKITGLSRCTIWRITRRYNITLSEKGIKRARDNSNKSMAGLKPWNKGRHLSKEIRENTNSDTSMVEIKPKNLVGKLKNPFKIEAAQKYCKDNGFIFKIITEEELGI